MNVTALYQEIILLLTSLGIRHEVHELPSGCVMVDIWKDDKFYVVQFEPDLAGLSQIDDENVGFDTIPDEAFHNAKEFMARLKMIAVD